jgi:hypothetical protein
MPMSRSSGGQSAQQYARYEGLTRSLGPLAALG